MATFAEIIGDELPEEGFNILTRWKVRLSRIRERRKLIHPWRLASSFSNLEIHSRTWIRKMGKGGDFSLSGSAGFKTTKGIRRAG